VHAHLEPFCGASGDMLLGALVDAGVPLEVLQQAVDALDLPNVSLRAGRVDKLGIAATRVDVVAPHQHHHRHLPDIEAIIHGSALADAIKDRSVAVFRVLAQAEAAVHDVPVAAVHFHEVGALDAIADVVAALAGLAHFDVTTVSCRALPVSHGTVHCEHGVLPVPAPAVLRLMEGLPTEPLDVSGETVTPTAAAILRTVVSHWGSAPAMRVQRHGYGAGQKAFARANVLRLTLGVLQQAADSDALVLLATNIDDMNPEWLPPVMERLLAAGARDVWLTPILMKKGRPGHTLSALADPSAVPDLQQIVYAHTTSLGIRSSRVDRHRLERDTVTVETPWGAVPVKVATLPDGEQRAAPEYEDCRRLSEAHDVPLQTLYQAALSGWRSIASRR
jgi:pyridinium-3,5-bisthiocarboxylic acid mononucleotide nickel chelatase